MSNSKAFPDACTIQSSFSPCFPLRKLFPVPNLDELYWSAARKLRAAVHTGVLKFYLFMRADCVGCSKVRKMGCLTEKPFLFQQATLDPERAFCPPPRRNEMQFCLHCSCGSTLTTRDGNTPLSPVFASEREITTTNTSREEELKASLPHKAKHKTKIPPAAPTQAPHSTAKHQAEIALSKIHVLSPFWIQPSKALRASLHPLLPWSSSARTTMGLPDAGYAQSAGRHAGGSWMLQAHGTCPARHTQAPACLWEMPGSPPGATAFWLRSAGRSWLSLSKHFTSRVSLCSSLRKTGRLSIPLGVCKEPEACQVLN